MKRSQALERLEKLTNELNDFVQSKVNIHKEIKFKTTSVADAFQRFKKPVEKRRSSLQHISRDVTVNQLLKTGVKLLGSLVREKIEPLQTQYSAKQQRRRT